jgi:hypothetical protein
MPRVEYKSPGATEWQVLELVNDRVHNRVWALCGPSESERRDQEYREAIRKAGQPQNMSEVLSALFGDIVPRRNQGDPRS